MYMVNSSVKITKDHAQLYSLLEIMEPQKAVFHVTDTRGYLILGHETEQQIGYIQFS